MRGHSFLLKTILVLFVAELSKTYQVVPNFQKWAPWIGESTRIGNVVLNTEFKKCAEYADAEITEAIPEELLFHLLQDEKV